MHHHPQLLRVCASWQQPSWLYTQPPASSAPGFNVLRASRQYNTATIPVGLGMIPLNQACVWIRYLLGSFITSLALLLVYGGSQCSSNVSRRVPQLFQVLWVAGAYPRRGCEDYEVEMDLGGECVNGEE
ncbi:hypothetical protein BKA70DRAFT_1419256 [Coprinopsis sp. MPI-PUGE-AT-0042]|nr:hypothetical protein BKA70DRAFT_1419256 [Coprinopsis sp. MPI-PUGE-AT-0042]